MDQAAGVVAAKFGVERFEMTEHLVRIGLRDAAVLQDAKDCSWCDTIQRGQFAMRSTAK